MNVNTPFIPNYTVPGFHSLEQYTTWCERGDDLADAGIFLHESTPQAELDQDLFRADLFFEIRDGLLEGLLSAPFFVTDSFAC